MRDGGLGQGGSEDCGQILEHTMQKRAQMMTEMVTKEDCTVSITGSEGPRFKSFPSNLLTNQHGQSNSFSKPHFLFLQNEVNNGDL